jgi:TIR domain
LLFALCIKQNCPYRNKFIFLEALRTSRCLIPVWSPQYFRSDWCKAELDTMLEREKILGLRRDHNWSGIIYPVVFQNAAMIPPEYRTIQYTDLSQWGIAAPAFRSSLEYLQFELSIKTICKKLWPMIQTAPDWQDNWPTIISKALPGDPFPVPRFL